jgi:CHAT domain-containing protein
VIVADPDFDLGRAAGEPGVGPPPGETRLSRALRGGTFKFPRLPGTRAEGVRVAELVGAEPWLGAAATEGSLKGCRSPRILHLATHGYFLPDQQPGPGRSAWPEAESGLPGAEGMARLGEGQLVNPLLRSGLALAGVNTWLHRGVPPDEAEDGLLTAEDVTGLDLLDTELVVLSACDTGLGQLHLGEGVLGLRRAFAVAGAKALVMSLWKVPDEETGLLMGFFYRMLEEGKSRADALWEAQLSVRDEFPHPRYWAAFILQGDPGPLETPRLVPLAEALR